MSAVVRITAEGDNNTIPVVNVMHWNIPNSAPVTEINGILTAMQTFYNAVKAGITAGTIHIGLNVVTVDQTPNINLTTTPLTVATTGGAVASASASAIISWKTPFVGRSFRGRTYLGPLATTAGTAQDGHNVLGSYVTTVQTAAATLLAFTTNGVAFVVWSKAHNTKTTITSAVVRANIGTQRRRVST